MNQLAGLCGAEAIVAGGQSGMLLAAAWVLAWALAGAEREVLPAVWLQLAEEYLAQEGPACPGCAEVRALLGAAPADLARAYHLERTKARLLEGLGLPAPPRPPQGPLPPPLASGAVFADTPRPRARSTQRIVVIPTEVSCEEEAGGVLRVGLQFSMPEWTPGEEVVKGWARVDGGGALPATLSSPPGGTEIHMHPAATGGGWLESNVTLMLREREDYFVVKIIRPSTNVTSVDCSFYQDMPQRAFISMDMTTDDSLDGARGKRNVNCVDGLSECCREKLFVSFDKIGWGDWIIQPRGYDAYYCKGTCSNTASIAVSGSPYHSVMQKIQMEGNKLDFIPCCTPTRLSSLDLIYRDKNNTFVHKIIPNLKVEACGCM